MKNDSDTPSSARQINSAVPFGAKPDSIVHVLHSARLPTTSFSGDQRSPRIPAIGEQAP